MARRSRWFGLAILASTPALAAACGSGAHSSGDMGARARKGGSDNGASGAGVCVGVDGGAPAHRFLPGVRLAEVPRGGCSEAWCPSSVLGLVVADFNGDGKDDVAYLDGLDADVLLSTGHGTFGAPIATAVAATLQSAYAMSVGDFNGDGRPDLLVETVTARAKGSAQECTASAVTVYLGNGDGTFTAGTPAVEPVKCTVYGTAIADFDGDGRSDALFAGGSLRNVQGLAFGPGQAAVMTSTGDGLVEKLDRTTYSSDFIATQAAAGDFNGDGFADLATETYGGIFVSLGQGGGAFGNHVKLTSIVDESLDSAVTQSIFAVDVNGDGFTDLVSSSSYAAYLRLGGPSSLGVAVAYPVGTSRVTAVADFDGDGHPDILAGEGPITLLPGLGDGTFGATSVEISTKGTYPGGVAVGDFDGDGLPDFVASGLVGSKLASLELFMNAGCTGGDILPECAKCAGTCTPIGCLEILAQAGPPAGNDGEVGSQVVVDASNVYWSSGEGVFQVPIAGGATTTLATGLAGGIAVDGSSVYFTTYVSVLSVPIGGGAVTTIATKQPGAMGVAVDSKTVFWTNGYYDEDSNIRGDVMRAPLAGGAATKFAAAQAWPTSIAVAAKEVYWVNTGCYDNPAGSVVMLGVDGGTPTTLQSGDTSTCGGGMFGLAVDATDVYSAPYGGPLVRIPLAGGAPQTLVAGTASSGVVAISGTSAYYVANSLFAGTLLEVPVGGGTPATQNSGLAMPGFWGGLAADAKSIYWTTGPDSMLVKLTPR